MKRLSATSHFNKNRGWIIYFLTFALFVTPLIIFILSFPSDWAGWLLLYATFLVPLFFKEFLFDGRLVLASFVSLLCYHAVAITNAFILTTRGGGNDASRFHRNALKLAEMEDWTWSFVIGTDFYEQFLSFFYRLFGGSLLLGEQLSILAFIISVVIFVKICNLLEISNNRSAIILLFAITPAHVFFGAVTLRESYQVLFVLLSVYWSLQLRRNTTVLSAVCLLLSVFGMALFHKGFVAYTLVFIILSFYWGLGYSDQKKRKFLKLFGLIFAVIFIFIWTIVMDQFGSAIGAVSNGTPVEYIQNYRERGYDPGDRAAYKIHLETSSPVELMVKAPLMFILYMFAPFPWQVGNLADVAAMGESILRAFLIYFAFSSWRRALGEDRSRFGFLLIVYFSMELIWSLGTQNWGTSIRHHVTTHGILVLLGGPGLIEYVKQTFQKMIRLIQ